MYRGRTTRLPDTHANPRNHQGGKTPGQSGEHGHGAPHQQCQRHDILAYTNIGPASNGNAGEGIEDRKGYTAKKSKLGVRQGDFSADRLNQNRKYLSINKIDDIDEQEQAQRVISIA